MNKTKFKDLVVMIGQSKWTYLFALLTLTLAIFSETVGNLLIRHMVDEVIILKKPIALLIYFSAIYLGVMVLRALFSFVNGRSIAQTSENVTRNIRKSLFDHIQRLSFHYHDKMQTGELIQRSTSDVDAVRRFYGDQLPGLIRILLLFSVNLVTCLVLEWRLALLSIIVVPIVVLMSFYFFNKIFNSYEEYQKNEGKMSSRIQESLSGIRVVRAFARQRWENERFEEINNTQKQKGFKLIFWMTCYWPLAHLLCGLQFVTTIFVGGMMVINDVITPGTFIAFSSMVNALIWPMQELGRMITELSKSTVSFTRINEVLSEEQEILHETKIDNGRGINGEICFNNVGFSYIEDVPVLEGINLSCFPGMKIALLGETGSGKTSLVNLLPRFYDSDKGEILLDGENIKKYSRHFLRQNIGIVEQTPFLFSMSVKENITYSLDRDVTDEEIIEATKAAAVHDSIVKFKDGYDTIVGEKGVSLSGGQKQRIAIARTILKNPKILILDDSTSAVDASTEELIRNALESLMKNRTTFIIAHRIQTLKSADLIVVMKSGKIIQRGTHEELVSSMGFYQEVFNLQTKIEDELKVELEKLA